MWLNNSETIEIEFIDSKNPIKHSLIDPVAKVIPKIIFKIAHDSNLGF